MSKIVGRRRARTVLTHDNVLTRALIASAGQERALQAVIQVAEQRFPGRVQGRWVAVSPLGPMEIFLSDSEPRLFIMNQVRLIVKQKWSMVFVGRRKRR